jgi:hypothetical protein
MTTAGDADGELLVVPQQGGLRFWTEFGIIDVVPGEICVIPRGVKMRVELSRGPARGYVCEDHGGAFTLPERGPIGASCLANPRDFLTPQAAYEDRDAPPTMAVKWGGALWAAPIGHSPLDVVAWHGNYAPYKYDLRRFSPVGPVLFDHADPSIFTVLTSPSETPGTANIDFVIFPDRWREGCRTPPLPSETARRLRWPEPSPFFASWRRALMGKAGRRGNSGWSRARDAGRQAAAVRHSCLRSGSIRRQAVSRRHRTHADGASRPRCRAAAQRRGAF